jgi:multiple antibiotic resistance protein
MEVDAAFTFISNLKPLSLAEDKAMNGSGIVGLFSEFVFGFGTLFAIINPYGLAFVFLNRTSNLTELERGHIARTIALYSLAVLVVSLFAGSTILGFFGISLPALRIAGGLVVAVTGWTMLQEPHDEPHEHPASGLGFSAVSGMVFFPLCVPLTTGPGTIAAAIALAANWKHELRGWVVSAVASLLVAAAIASTIYHAYRHASTMARLFGPEGTRVVTRLSAFLLLCVGVEIMLTGASDAVISLIATRS